MHISKTWRIHITVVLSYVLVKVWNGGECCLAVLTLGLSLVDRNVLGEGVLAGEPLKAFLTLKRLESSLDRFRVPIAWSQNLESGKWKGSKIGCKLNWKRSRCACIVYFLTTTDMDSKMFAFEVKGCLQCISMVLLHMLVQVWHTWESVSTVLTVGSALMGLLMVD